MKTKRLLTVIMSGAVLLAAGCTKDKSVDTPQYAITVPANTDGSVEVKVGDNEVTKAKAAATVTLTADPDDTYRFKAWTVRSGEEELFSLTTNPATFTMPGKAVEITAEFETDPDWEYAVTVPAVANGSVEVKVGDNEVTKAKAAATVTLTATANKDYAFARWIVTGGTGPDDDTANPATLTMPAEDVTVGAEFGKVGAEANSYMVLPGGEVLFIPVSQANRVLDMGDVTGLTTTGLDRVATDNYTAELVWANAPVGAGGVLKSIGTAVMDGKGYVKVEPGVAGNAVVAIRVGGNVRWSWHVWVTPAVGQETDANTGLTWMDRNLGAAGEIYNTSGRNGLFYQWGRKDAFPGSEGTTAAFATGSYTDLPDMVRNPLIFATNNETFYGSLSVGGDTNDSWGGVSGVKSAFDPCPERWKVPPATVGETNSWGVSDDWGSWANLGRIFKAFSLNHFYPATGYRLVNTGGLTNVGSYGNYWAAVPSSSTYGRNLYFTSNSVNGVNTVYSYSRGYGLAVRCVRE